MSITFNYKYLDQQGLLNVHFPWNPPEQDTEVYSVPDQGSCSCQQLHPGTQKQQPVSGADRALLLPSLQAHPWKILCGPPGCFCWGIGPDFVGLCMCVGIKIYLSDLLCHRSFLLFIVIFYFLVSHNCVNFLFLGFFATCQQPSNLLSCKIFNLYLLERQPYGVCEDIFFPSPCVLWCVGGPGGPYLLFQHVQRVQVHSHLASVPFPVRSCEGFSLRKHGQICKAW